MTKEQNIEQEFRKELQAILDKYDAEINLDQSEQLLAYTKFLRDELHLNISDTWVESYVKNSK